MHPSRAAAVLVALGTAHTAAAADLFVNGNFVAEDFNAAAAWLGVDDKYGTASQADDIASGPMGPRTMAPSCASAKMPPKVGGSGGGVWGAHIEQSLALEAGRTYTLGFGPQTWGPAPVPVQVHGQAAGALLDEAVMVAPRSSSYGSTHSRRCARRRWRRS
jgi:hypothetical protein